MKAIQILLPTYNGASYLDALLNSLSRQTLQDFTLIARDDGSTDTTLSILKKWQEELENFTLLEDQEHLGIVGGINRLLAESDAPYLLFCDQDDVWKEDKIEKSLNAMVEGEITYGQKTPLLVHTDLEVVDSTLHQINPSFTRYAGLHPTRKPFFDRLLHRNFVTGCTVMINHSLKQLSTPLPSDCVMHDWWIALCAAAFGEILYLDEPSVCYRQHGGNTLGATPRFSWRHLKKISKRLLNPSNAHDQKRLCQAQIFYERFEEQLDSCRKKTLEGYIRKMQWPLPLKTVWMACKALDIPFNGFLKG